MTTGSEPGPEMFVVVTVNVAAGRLEQARLITEHRRQECAVFMVVVLSERNHNPAKRKGRGLNTPFARGTAKRLMQEDAPSRAPVGRWLSAAPAFENSRFSGEAAAVLR